MEIAEITENLDIEFWLDQESLPYKRTRGASGDQLNVKTCPKCGDARWRTYLNAETGRGNCFVCNATFNKLGFVHAHLGHGDGQWRDTILYAKQTIVDQGWRPKRMATAAVTEASVKLPYSHELPLESGENLLYLEQRGIDADLVRYFRLRWCEYGWWDFDVDGERKKQFFSNRVIIPVYDIDGELKTFQGRDLTGKSDRKYLFPIGLPGTGRYLFNAHNVYLTKEIALGEGAFDAAAIKRAMDEEVALRHVVALGTFGKHLSYGALDGNDQLGRLLTLKSMGIERATIMWDGEKKALEAALDAAKLIAGIGIQARVALLPAGKDPNEVLPEIVRKAYYEAQLWTPKLDITWRLRNPYR